VHGETAGTTDTKIVYFMRHGQSEANAMGHGIKPRDPALTELGCRQATAWRSETTAWGVDKVLVSPLQRTMHTALLAFAPGCAMQVRCCLREHGWDDPQNQGSPLPELMANLAACNVDVSCVSGLRELASPHEHWDPVVEPSLGKEELHKRRQRATRYLERKLLEEHAGTLAVVAHYVTIKHFVKHKLHNCQVVRAVFKKQRGRWSLSVAEMLDVPNMPADLPVESPAMGAYAAEKEACEHSSSDSSDGSSSDCDDIGLDQVDVEVPESVAKMYAQGCFRSSSVMVVGMSEHHDAYAALLGGANGRHGYRYCDFGGGLDGGSVRFGGHSLRNAERKWPHLGAFRELAEEFAGLHGHRARDLGREMWNASKGNLIGGSPVAHGKHLVFIVPAEAILDCVLRWSVQDRQADGRTKSLRKGSKGVDELLGHFRSNAEVSDVKLFRIVDLLECRQEGVSDCLCLSPIWKFEKEGGRVKVFCDADQTLLEAAFSIGDDTMLQVEGGKFSVRPVSKSIVGQRHRRYSVNRLTRACIRGSISGPRGSLASCAEHLQSLL
jgi:broad specificity phosphatase PhoE